mmetsp:Transcript_63344/g.133593  ORF Transcript_63344/g.133593 Transcript_63344/m.133593 type:complete len:156 (-) Transcript_63344:384-851(-)
MPFGHWILEWERPNCRVLGRSSSTKAGLGRAHQLARDRERSEWPPSLQYCCSLEEGLPADKNAGVCDAPLDVVVQRGGEGCWEADQSEESIGDHRPTKSMVVGKYIMTAKSGDTATCRHLPARSKQQAAMCTTTWPPSIATGLKLLPQCSSQPVG